MELSLAGWSLNSLFRRPQDPLKLLDFPRFARETFDIDAVELNNIYFESTEPAYIDRLVKATSKSGSIILNIAVDVKGDLSSGDDAARLEAVKGYAQWIPIAKAVGATAIRANSGGKEVTDRDAAINSCIDSFRRLYRDPDREPLGDQRRCRHDGPDRPRRPREPWQRGHVHARRFRQLAGGGGSVRVPHQNHAFCGGGACEGE
jgi:hypothetical protein